MHRPLKGPTAVNNFRVDGRTPDPWAPAKATWWPPTCFEWMINEFFSYWAAEIWKLSVTAASIACSGGGLVAKLCPTLCNPMDCSSPGSSLHEILQARILAWVAISFSEGSSPPRGQAQVSCITSRFLTDWATREARIQFSSVQSLSCVRLFATPWTAARQASLSITNSWSPPKPMSIELVMPSNHLILCHPLLLLPSIFPSIRVFSNESALGIRWPKYWNFSFNISPSNEYSGLISFRINWFHLLAVQGTLKSLLQHHSSKASILQCSDSLIFQLSHPYMTTGKTIALTIWIFVGKVMSLLFNMLSRLVITFRPRSKHLLISWMQ